MVECEGKVRMNWWVWLLIPVFAVFGLAAGWVAGSILIAFRNEPYDIWEDWED